MHRGAMERRGRGGGLFKASEGGIQGHDTTWSQRFWEMEGVQGAKGGMKGGQQEQSPAGDMGVSPLGQHEQLFKMIGSPQEGKREGAGCKLRCLYK